MIGLIGGTGLGQALFGEAGGEERWVDTPFGRPSGPVRLVQWRGLRLAILARHGEGHVLNPSQVPYRANIFALKKLGVTHVLATGAVGSLREEIHPRDLVIVDQVIDRTYRRVPTFYDELAVHVEFAQPYCRQLRDVLKSAVAEVDARVHPNGTYVCMEGPAFSTVAESISHRTLGGDVVGMTTMPEAKLAREAEMCYAQVALATDHDCWKPHDPGISRQALMAEIIGNLKQASANAAALLKAALGRLAEAPPGECDCQRALDLAIWSDRAAINRAAVERLSPLLDRCLHA
ncbi:MAG: S-methyl-5'-thioadenosine phosphorylase [Phycisphaerae bacterium]|nr:S-methyl-5'-thioadenosine phosphorylase [Phycisphaerae bacterium]